MTSEVIVMNKNGMAIAADSAVTRMPERRASHSQRKIFPLAPPHSIALMVHEKLRLNGIPWETIIKIFQSQIGEAPLARTEDYMARFIEFIQTSDHIMHQNNINWFGEALEYLKRLDHEIYTNWQKNKTGHISLRAYAAEFLQKKSVYLQGEPDAFPSDYEILHRQIKAEFEGARPDVLKQVFRLFAADADIQDKIIDLLTLQTLKNVFDFGYSGIVIAGLGKEDLFPSVSSVKVGGVYFNRLKYEISPKHSIHHTNQAQIIPYGETETITAFFKGVHPSYEDFSLGEFKRIMADCMGAEDPRLLDDCFERYKDRLMQHVLSRHIEPVIEGIKFLPQEGLANIAESLVMMTCFKTAVVPDKSFVGGDVNVAVISKSDGFQWLRYRALHPRDPDSHETRNGFPRHSLNGF